MGNIHFICFIEALQEDTEFCRLISKIDENGGIVHIYSSCCTQNMQPHDILNSFDLIERDSNDLCFLVTEIPDVMNVCYRLYHHIFDGFVYVTNNQAGDIHFDEIYETIIKSQKNEKEVFNKNIYCNSCEGLSEFCCDCLPIAKLLDYFNNENSYGNLLRSRECVESNADKVANYYYFQDQFYYFEPSGGSKKRIINLNAGNNRNGICDSSLDLLSMQNYENTTYIYYYCNEQLKDLHSYIIEYYHDPDTNMKNVYSSMNELSQSYEPLSPLAKLMVERCIWDMADIHDCTVNVKLWLLSWLIYVADDRGALEEMLKLTLESSELTSYNKYYIWNQVKRISLEFKDMASQLIADRHMQLYNTVYEEYFNSIQYQMQRIGKEERNKDLVLVFATSFLGERHAPTRTTLERVYTLGKLMGKTVMLINTRETLTRLGEMPLYYNHVRTLIEDYCQIDSYQYKDYSFPFLQLDSEMPEYIEIAELINFVKMQKPYFILNIGGGSLVSDLCSNIVPVLSMSVAFSTLPFTKSKLSILGRKVQDYEWNSLYQNGYDKDSIIESRFTFDLIPKHSELSREGLQLPSDKFLLLIVGIRLDSEITEEFIEAMERTYEYGTYLVFAGRFDTYNDFCERKQGLKEHSSFIGYYNDMLALNAICDLYVNPFRLGGGFSIIEAFREGKPGVSIAYGDVATAAGEEFCIQDYEGMISRILRFISDKEYYEQMSVKARERASLMTDSKSAMEEIVSKAEKSKYFF